jgi:sarcosine oxidase
MPDTDVVVVGAGVMGSAAAWRLAARGREVVVLEQFDLCHDRGSSHGAVRVFRFSYSDPYYVQMAMDALLLWRELEEEAGRGILTVTGGYDFGPPGVLEANVAALAERGASFDLIDGAEVQRRFPAVSLAAETVVLHQPDAGAIAAERAVKTFAERAVHHGASLHERSPVQRIEVSEEGVNVLTANETYRCRVAVVTAGAWARKLLEDTGIDLPVVPSRETVAFFLLPDDPPLPVLVEWSDSSPTYALPSPGQGVKVGWHRSGPETDPDTAGWVDRRVLDHLSRWAAEHYPSADREPHHIETCMYTNTSDERFILQRHGALVVGSACSGHGFKFAPLIGERLAQLAMS